MCIRDSPYTEDGRRRYVNYRTKHKPLPCDRPSINTPEDLSLIHIYIVDGSFLEEYDEYNIGVQFKAAATVSITYALMSRCGLEPERYFCLLYTSRCV